MRYCPIVQYGMIRYSPKSGVESEVKMLGVSAVDCDMVPYVRVLVYDTPPDYQRVSLC